MGEQEKSKIDYFKNIIAVAYADGKLDQIEKEFLIEKAQDLNIPIENVDHLIEEVKEMSRIIPVEDYDREEQLADAIATAVLDGDITDDEIKVCMEIGEALGFDEKYINFLIENSLNLWKKFRS